MYIGAYTSTGRPSAVSTFLLLRDEGKLSIKDVLEKQKVPTQSLLKEKENSLS